MKRFLIAGLFLVTSSLQSWGAAHPISDEETGVTFPNSPTSAEHQLMKRSCSAEKQLPTTFEDWAKLSKELQLKVLSFLPYQTLQQLKLTSRYNSLLSNVPLVDKMPIHNSLVRWAVFASPLESQKDYFALVKRIEIEKLDNFAQHINHFLPLFKNLEILKLRNNKLGTKEIQTLIPVLRDLTRLQTLDLGLNNIEAAGAQALAPALHALPELRTLDLSYNIIGVAGVRALATALRVLPHLRTLNLSYNYIRAAGAQALAEAIPNLTQLQTLDLGGNYIGAAGAQALAEGIPALTQLQTLNLGRNDLRDDGARTLAGAQALAGVQALVRVLPAFTQLQTLDLGGNFIGDDEARALAIAALPGLRIYYY